MQEVKLRTGIWYGDRPVRLSFPDSWDIITHWPHTPLPLRNEDILRTINAPIGQPPLYEAAKSKKRPLIIVDDLARPTPVYRIMPFLLRQFEIAGISCENIRILVATGTHGHQNRDALTNKIGNETLERCRVIVHNDKEAIKFIGKTSFRTPVYVNKEVLDSDFVIGVGGVYPQHTVGFGGGSKLALGVLGRRSIMHLHYCHASVGGTYNIDNDFRRDVSEIARMIRLNTMFTLHIDAHLEMVNLMCGDHFMYYSQAARFSREQYAAPSPDDADVVISNGYPFDTSFTFMRKAYKPLDVAPRQSTKVIIASNHEGIGTHGLFQHMKPPRFMKYRLLYRQLAMKEPKEILSKILKRVTFKKQPKISTLKQNYALPKNTEHLWVYSPDNSSVSTSSVEGITVVSRWDDILEAVEREQLPKEKIKVRIYPCAALQCLEADKDPA
jgi:nickel-dependent lactate racemase